MVTQVTRKLGLLSWLERALEDDVGCWHPKEEVGSFGTGGEDGGIRYVVFRGKEVIAGSEGMLADVPMQDVGKAELEVVADGKEDSGDGTTMGNTVNGSAAWHCRIVVNREAICTKSGWNRLEVETAAAEEAIAILRARKVGLVAQKQHEIAGPRENDDITMHEDDGDDDSDDTARLYDNDADDNDDENDNANDKEMPNDDNADNDDDAKPNPNPNPDTKITTTAKQPTQHAASASINSHLKAKDTISPQISDPSRSKRKRSVNEAG